MEASHTKLDYYENCLNHSISQLEFTMDDSQAYITNIVSNDLKSKEEGREFLTEGRRTHRRVHFDVDRYDAIIEYHYLYPKNECTDSYTTGDEEFKNTIEKRRDCCQMRKSNSQLIRRLNDVYENDEYTNDINIFNEWVASDLRGFESYFLSESQLHIRA